MTMTYGPEGAPLAPDPCAHCGQPTDTALIYIGPPLTYAAFLVMLGESQEHADQRAFLAQDDDGWVEVNLVICTRCVDQAAQTHGVRLHPPVLSTVTNACLPTYQWGPGPDGQGTLIWPDPDDEDEWCWFSA
jgi:hypothetical protein